jgi:SRSO17 transposase
METRCSGWKRELLRAHGLIADLFARSEPRARSLGYLQGLLSGCERKNRWQLAECMGEAAPYALQHLMDRDRWDADTARDKIRNYVLEEVVGSIPPRSTKSLDNLDGRRRRTTALGSWFVP